MIVEVWSDVVCPWCYIGKRRLEGALAQVDGDVQVVWRSFQLDPNTPQNVEQPVVEMLAEKYGMSLSQAREAQARVVGAAATEGLDFDFESAKTGNTFDAHRLIHLADSHGKQDAMKERLMAAYFTEGRAIGDRETLVALGVEVGLEEAEVRATLGSARFGDAVKADIATARALGVTAVPCFVLDRRVGISGAQPSRALAQAITEALAQAAPGLSAAGPSCDADGCEV